MTNYHQLTLKQRYAIARHLRNGKKFNQIAIDLGVHRSTIYREVKRNTMTFAIGEPSYTGTLAEQLAYEKRCRRRKNFRKINPQIASIIVEKLKQGWSPEQISGRLRLEERIKISHETIYRFILEDQYGCGDLFRYLRAWRYKKSRFGSYRRFRWDKKRSSIERRPVAANKRSEIGHWERDLVIGKRGGHHLMTLVDRKSRFTIIRKVSSRHSHAIYKQMRIILNKFPQKFKTITNDNGKEFSDFDKIKKKYGTKTYFAHPYSSWERGTNENMNKLIREYLPKKTDFTKINKTFIAKLEEKLNHRPRKILNYRTPSEVFNKNYKEFF